MSRDGSGNSAKKRLLETLSDQSEIQRLLVNGPEDMTMREKAIYIAGYCIGFDAGEINQSRGESLFD